MSIDTLLTGADRMINEFDSKGLKVGEIIIELDFNTWEALRVQFVNIMRYSHRNRRDRGDPPDLIYRRRVRFRAVHPHETAREYIR